MKMMHTTSSRDNDTPSMTKVSWGVTPSLHAISKVTRVWTKAELAILLGVHGTELKRLGRRGIFHRLGDDRYLLDCHRCALLLNNKQGRPYVSVNARFDRRLNHPVPDNINESTHKKSVIYHGYDEFYRFQEEKLDHRINIINVPELNYAELVAGRFLSDGLKQKEQVAVVSFEQPDQMLLRLAESGVSLDQALESEQLIYLYYKPDVAHSISLSNNYMELLDEVVRFSGSEVKRLVLLNIDALINCNSEHLVHASLHKFIYAVNHFRLTTLGLFVASGHAGSLLDEGCRTLLPGYFILD